MRPHAAPRAATKRFTAKRAQAEAEAEPVPASDRYYGNWLALPIQPGDQRITTRTELVKGRMWGLEQTQGVLNVLVNVRMTVVKLADGGLLCWCPVAPTRECVRLVEELGEVKYVVLPTTALEHKVISGGFPARNCCFACHNACCEGSDCCHRCRRLALRLPLDTGSLTYDETVLDISDCFQCR